MGLDKSLSLTKIKFIPANEYAGLPKEDSEIYAVQYERDVKRNSFPDWGRAIGCGNGTTYTVGAGAIPYKFGYVWCSHGIGGRGGLYINGTLFLNGYTYQDGIEGKLIFTPLVEGNTFSSSGARELIFIPAYGA